MTTSSMESSNFYEKMSMEELSLLKLHKMFDSQVSQSPDKVAVQIEDTSLTYNELSVKCDSISKYLVGCGVTEGDVVALALPRSFNFIACCLGIMKAGAAYLPLDISSPPERLRQILAESKAVLVFSIPIECSALYPTDYGTISLPSCAVVDLSIIDSLPPITLPTRFPLFGPEVACVFYTSGSTGKPKGVLMLHRAIINRQIAVWEHMPHSQDEVGCQRANITFVTSLSEIYSNLLRGVKLVLVPDVISKDLNALVEYLHVHAVTRIFLVPSLLNAILSSDITESALPRLKMWVTAGEAIGPGIVGQFRSAFSGAALVNLFGLTEAGSLVHRIYDPSTATNNSFDSSLSIPIGKPIRNATIYILDSYGQPVNTGDVGELFIGGLSVAGGYLNDPERTAERFLTDPFTSNNNNNNNNNDDIVTDGDNLPLSAVAVYYKTGDLVRELPDGNIEYIGRSDFQVKIRGMRVELGEIESAIITQTVMPVQACAVVVNNDSLHAFVVMKTPTATADDHDNDNTNTSSNDDSVTMLYNDLMSALPAYMVPSESCIRILSALPLTANGKLDRKALIDLTDEAHSPTSVASNASEDTSLSALQREILGILSGLLKIPHLRLHDNFFHRGGHSLLLMQLFARIKRQYDTSVSPVEFYDNPTAAFIAHTVEAAQQNEASCGVVSLVAPPLMALSPKPIRSKVSYAQQRMWLLDQLSQCKAVYNISLAWDLSGALDVPLLQQALNTLLARHNSLRTVFQSPADDSTALEQVVLKDVTCEIAQVNASSRDVAMCLVRIEADTDFNLSQGPLVRAKLMHIADGQWVFQLTMHHIVTDGWSSGVIKRDLAEIYNALLAAKSSGGGVNGGDESPSVLSVSPIRTDSLQYTDYSVWQRDLLSRGDYIGPQLEYWKATLQDAPQNVELLVRKKASAVKTQIAANHYTTLPADLVARLQAVASDGNATLFMVLLSGLHLLLVKYSTQRDTVIGSPVSGRSTSDGLADMVGFFVNTIALRVQSTETMSFSDLITAARNTVLGAMQNQEVPFDMVVSSLNLKRELGGNPLFQVMLDFQSSAPAPLSLSGLNAERIEIGFTLAKFELVLHAVMTDNGSCNLCFEYATDVYEEAAVAQMAKHFDALLHSIVTAPSTAPLTALSVISAAEKQQVLVDWNQTTEPFPDNITMHQWVQQRALSHPNVAAVVVGSHSLSYAELDSKATQVAVYLQSLGVVTDSIVAISLNRSVDFIVWALGVLKAGGAYLPLDTKYPDDRLLYMVQDAKPVVLVTHSRYDARFTPVPINVTIVHCDQASAVVEAQNGTNLVIVNDPTQLAYVIYTSGSTGKPKGVMIEHRGLCNLVHSFNDDFAGRRILQVASNSFDAAVFEIWTCLGSGGTLVLAEPEDLLFGDSLYNLLKTQRINVALITPAALATLDDDVCLPELKVLYVGGDATSEKLLSLWLKKVDKLVNAYGPTEITVIATRLVCDGTKSSRVIGRPLPNTFAYVLDENHQPVPLGLPGELYIGGTGVARGYLHNPVMTAEKFVTNPFVATDMNNVTTTQDTQRTRMYRTGDLVRYLPCGNLEFLGRADGQVKLRGFRIECGEIERAICQHVKVKDSVVVLREDMPGQPQLVAYLVANDFGGVTSDVLTVIKQSLTATLPVYMVPFAFVVLDTIPITPNGKTDKAKLPTPAQPSIPKVPSRPSLFASDRGDGGMRSGTTKTLSGIWQQVLGLSQTVGLDVNFFDAGGNSLSLTAVHSKLPPAWKAVVTLMDLFKYSTIRTLAEYISSKTAAAVNKTIGSPDFKFSMMSKRSLSLDLGGGSEDSIAIIGIGCTVPGANTPTQFWDNLVSGVESIKRYSDTELLEIGVSPRLINDPNYVKARGAINDIRGFDAEFFGITAREAEIMDPQQRVFLECAWAAIEDAGYDPRRYQGHIGVYAGSGDPRYYTKNLLTRPEVIDEHGHYLLGMYNNKDMLATRAAHKLGLTGPAIGIQTACSSSLVAVHQACQALLSNDCHMALAGGVSLGDLEGGYMYQEGMILSADGHCRAFDAKAGGTVPGQGAGLVMLKRLSQAMACGDSIYAIIKGSAINNDGSAKIGFTAPSAERQAKVIRQARLKAGVAPTAVSYIEAHGTGTKMGDPIEMSGLIQALGAAQTDVDYECRIGSVKTNIGHLDAASGVVGLIKATLSLVHKQIPATLHYNTPSVSADDKFPVNDSLSEWPDACPHNRIAGVSSFGIGGTNAHVVMEEYNNFVTPKADSANGCGYVVLPLSAKNADCLQEMSKNLSVYLSGTNAPTLADVAYTLQNGRGVFSHRRIVVAKSHAEAAEQLLLDPSAATKTVVPAANSSQRNPVVFAFCGQGGAAVTGDGRCDLYARDRTYRNTVNKCITLLNAEFESHSFAWSSKTSALFAMPAIDDTYLKQIELFIVEYALAEMYISWNIIPDLVFGHSLGEYTAACIAGVVSLKDALSLVVQRALLMRQLPPGSMMSVQLSHEQLLGHIEGHDDVDVAGVNAEDQCVVSGTVEDILKFRDALKEKNILCKVLPLPHAFHSRQTEGIHEQLAVVANQVKYSAPRIRFVSTATGCEIDSTIDGTHWVEHLAKPVLFSPVVQELRNSESFGNAVYLELGPGRLLSNLIKSHLSPVARSTVVASLGDVKASSEYGSVLLSVGQLWLNNIDVDWEAMTCGGTAQKLRRVHLPTYPFKHKEFWIPAPPRSGGSSGRNSGSLTPVSWQLPSRSNSNRALASMAEIEDSRVTRVWKSFFRMSDIGPHDKYADLGGDSLMAVRLASLLEAEFSVSVNSSIFMLHDTIAKQTAHFAAQTEALSQTPVSANNGIESTRSESPFESLSNRPFCSNKEDGPAKAFELLQLSAGEPGHLPLILIHPIGGTVNTYKDLMSCLPKSQPIFAFQALSPFGKATPYTDFKAMCTDYVAELRRAFPGGDGQRFILAGSSYGGIAAYEMANIIKSHEADNNNNNNNNNNNSNKQQNVDSAPLVIMLDSPVPGTIAPFTGLAPLLVYLFAQKTGMSADEQHQLAELEGDQDAQLDYIYTVANQHTTAHYLPDRSMVHHIVNTWTAHGSAMYNHTLQPYDGNVLFFRALIPSPRLTNMQHTGWLDLCTRSIEVRGSNGTHLSMNESPCVEIIAEHIHQAIQRHSNVTPTHFY